MSGCVVLQLVPKQTPALPKPTTARRIWSQLSALTSGWDKNPNDPSVHRDQLLQSTSRYGVTFLHLCRWQERWWNEDRSFCSFLFFLATRDSLQERTGLGRKEKRPFFVSAFLIDDLVYGCLLVPWSSDNVLVIHGYIAAQHRGRLFRLQPKKKTKERKY